MTYKFVTEDGSFDMEYSDFLKSPVLMDRVRDKRRLNIYAGRLIVSVDRKWLYDHPTTRKEIEWLENDMEQNSLKYYMPCCAMQDGFEGIGHQFINDVSRRFKAYVAPNRVGKALWDEELVQLVNGPKRICDVRVGDIGFDSRGHRCNVTGTFPQGPRQTYRIKLGGDEVIADGDHLWVCKYIPVKCRGSYEIEEHEWEVHTTEHISKHLGKGSWVIPRTDVVQFDEYIVSGIGPYKLGREIGYKQTPIGPELWQLAPEPRKRLLRGIMDTIATVDSRNRVKVTSKNPEFIQSLRTLCATFGAATTLENHSIGTRIRIGKFPFEPFGGVHKNEHHAAKGRLNVREIQRIEKHEMLPCTCIEVDSPNSTFLCNNFIVTHNTTSAWISMLTTAAAIPCDPDWPIFREHGIRYVPYTGPKEIGVMTYDWNQFCKTVIPQVILKWVPKKELGKWIDFKPNPKSVSGTTIRLGCGTKIHLFALSQGQASVESLALDDMMWDEQGSQDKFLGVEARLANRVSRIQDGNDRIIVNGTHRGAFTPHKLKDRPDSGASGWMYNVAYPRHRGDHLGFDPAPKFYYDTLKDVPHWIYNEEEKQSHLASVTDAEDAYKSGVGSIKMVRDLRARYMGEWEESGGAVFPEFDRKIHVVDDFEIPPNWTLRRSFDHGRTNPSAMSHIYTCPKGFLYVAKCILLTDSVIHKTVRHFIEKSGNSLEPRGKRNGDGVVFDEFREKNDTLCSYEDILDCNSFTCTTDSAELTIGDLWQMAGLHRLRPSVKTPPAKRIEVLRSLLDIRVGLTNPVTGADRSPKIFFFRNGAAPAISDIMKYRNKEVTNQGILSEVPVGKDDHSIDSIEYGVLEGAPYRPTRPCRPLEVSLVTERKPKKSQRARDPFTGCRL